MGMKLQLDVARGWRPTSTLRLILPYPPTVNHYWVHIIINGKSRIALGSIGRQYREDCRAALLESPDRQRVVGRCSVEVIVYPPTLQRFDLDNRLKPLLDALVTCGVIDDDSFIDRLTISRGCVARTGPRAEVVIQEAAVGMFAGETS